MLEGSELSDASDEEGNLTIYMSKPDSDTPKGAHQDNDNDNNEGNDHHENKALDMCIADR